MVIIPLLVSILLPAFAWGGDIIFNDDFTSEHLNDKWVLHPAQNSNVTYDIQICDGWLVLGKFGDTALYLNLQLDDFTLDFDFIIYNEKRDIDFCLHPRYNPDDDEWNECVIWLYKDQDIVNCIEGNWRWEDYFELEIPANTIHQVTIKCQDDYIKVDVDDESVLFAPIYVPSGCLLFETYGGAVVGIDNVLVRE